MRLLAFILWSLLFWQSNPVITSAPSGAVSGSVAGTGFGSSGDIFIRPRIKRSALGKYKKDECPTGERSLLSLMLDSDAFDLGQMHVIQAWGGSSVSVEFSAESRSSIADIIKAKTEDAGCPVADSDIEYGWQVTTSGLRESAVFYP